MLADVFEKFRNNSFKKYRLSPSHYLRAPAFSWNAIRIMIKVEFELIPDPGMHIVFEKGMRSGVSYISHRYSNTNNKYLKSYDPKPESKHYIFRSK